MNAIITFFLWLFGWAPVDAPAPAQMPLQTPVARSSSAISEGFEPEKARSGQKQTVTIIIYDDTHFRVK